MKLPDLIQELCINEYLMGETRGVQNRPTTYKVKGNTERNSRISRKLQTQRRGNKIYKRKRNKMGL